jgi:AP-1 complex subunit mu
VGSVKMRVYLSGMPELRLGLNDKVLFESTGRKYTLLPQSSKNMVEY